MENVSWAFRRWGICAVVCYCGIMEWFGSKGAFNDHLIPPPLLLLPSISPALFRQPSQLCFHFSWKAIPQAHPSLSRFFQALFQSFPCSAEPGCSVTPSQAGLGHCHHPFLLGFAEGSWPWGILPVLLWSSCSQLTKSTWTAVLRGEWVSASMKFGICAGGSTAAAWPSLSGSPRH